jgi:GntR family transcriptional regulator, trigonelline degradation regulator
VATGELGLLVDREDRLLRDRVTDALRQAIIRGTLEPGRRLTERELGQLTGVSRTSLREALRSLQAEGLVESSSGRGLQVTVLTDAIVSELYDVRVPLEEAAVELCVKHASDDQIATLRSSLLQVTPDDPDRQLESTREFYDLLLDAAGNSILEQLAGIIEARMHSSRRVSLRMPGRVEASRRELLDVVELIAQRDAVGAARAARVHVLAAKEAALTVLETPAGPPSREPLNQHTLVRLHNSIPALSHA